VSCRPSLAPSSAVRGALSLLLTLLSGLTFPLRERVSTFPVRERILYDNPGILK